MYYKWNIPPKCILNIANLDILNIPIVHPRQASIELNLCGHVPSGEVSAPGIAAGSSLLPLEFAL